MQDSSRAIVLVVVLVLVVRQGVASVEAKPEDRGGGRRRWLAVLTPRRHSV